MGHSQNTSTVESQWLMPVILDTQEAEIRRIAIHEIRQKSTRRHSIVKLCFKIF
jgi:hypothetical protein